MKKIMGKLIQLFTGSSEAYPKQYYPVGWILESAVNVNPSTFCIGTWELYGKGRVAACIDTGDSDFNTAGKEVGEKTHKLTIDEMPSHNHIFGFGYYNWTPAAISQCPTLGGRQQQGDVYTTDTGGNQPHNNIQPTVVVYRWKRIS